MSPRAASLLVALAALLALGVAYFAQDFLHMNPCPLCLWERWPYRILAALGVLAALSPLGLARFMLGIAALTMLAGSIIALIHAGAEFHWWQSPLPECNDFLRPGAPLPLTPAKSCDEPTFLIPHLPISFAAMDFIVATTLALAICVYLISNRKQAA